MTEESILAASDKRNMVKVTSTKTGTKFINAAKAG